MASFEQVLTMDNHGNAVIREVPSDKPPKESEMDFKYLFAGLQIGELVEPQTRKGNCSGMRAAVGQCWERVVREES